MYNVCIRYVNKDIFNKEEKEMMLYKISTWHKITAEKMGDTYTAFECVKSVFGGTWEKTPIWADLSLEQVKELKTRYDAIK